MTNDIIEFNNGEVLLDGNLLKMSPLREKNRNTFKFLEELHNRKIKEFMNSGGFTTDCSLIRVLIPTTLNTIQYHSIEGIELILKELSYELPIEVDVLENYEFFMLLVPIYSETTRNPYLSLNLLLKPELSLEMLISLNTRLEELNMNEMGVQYSMSSNMLDFHFLDNFRENEFLMYEEYPDFLDTCFNSFESFNIDELEFLITWGSYNVRIKEGMLYCEMLDLNRLSFK